jgi:hypothetical protein
MMADKHPFINLYGDNPTDGRTDGTLISLDEDTSSPIQATVNASKEETQKQKMALRCEEGYLTNADTTIWFKGANADKWSVSLTEDGTYASTLIITDAISDKNVTFWVAASGVTGELPDVDTTVKLKVRTNIKKLVA